MNKITGFVILAVISSITISCEKEIDFTNQTPPSQIYANCILNPDSVLRVYVSYTIPLTAPASHVDRKLEEAEKALVLIRNADNSPYDTLELVEGYYETTHFLVFESPTGKKPMPHALYKLDVSEPLYPGRKTVEARNHIPAPMSPVFVLDSTLEESVTNSDKTFNFEVEWNDPNPLDTNYFMIEVIYKNTSLTAPINPTEYTRSEIYAISDNFNMQDVGQSSDKFLYLFFDDSKRPDLIPGTPPPIKIKTKIGVVKNIFDNWMNSELGGFDSDLQVKVHHMTFELYRYYKEVEQYRATSGSDIFAQPVPVHGNAERGLGIFGGETIKQAILTLN